MPKVDASAVKNILLMLAPVALLGAMGLLLQKRDPAVFTVKEPFRIFVKQVRLVPVSPGEVRDGYDTKVEVELGARGRATPWWQKGFGGYSSTPEGQVVIKNGPSIRAVGVPWHTRPHIEDREKNPSRWVTSYLLKLAPVPADAGDVRLRHRIQVENSNTRYGPPVWLDTIVRRNGTATQIPTVSRDPQLVLERWIIDEAPPVNRYQGAGKSDWRLSLAFRKKGVLSEAIRHGVGDDLELRDASGKKQMLSGTTMWPTNLHGSYTGGSQSDFDRRRSFIIHEFSDRSAGTPGLKPPVWIEGEASWNKNWPLWIKIPLRDAQGKILLTPRPAPAFRVFSTSVRAATKTEKTWSGNGTDTVVKVLLQASNPQANVSKWDWEGDFSQHVKDASERSYWTFPLNGGSPKQPSSVSYETSHPSQRITLHYALALASIPKSAGALTFHAKISANGSRRVPVSVVVRPSSAVRVGK